MFDKIDSNLTQFKWSIIASKASSEFWLELSEIRLELNETLLNSSQNSLEFSS